MGSDYASGEPEGEDGPVIFSNLAEASPTEWNERPYLQEGYIKHTGKCVHLTSAILALLVHPNLVAQNKSFFFFLIQAFGMSSFFPQK